ncbi:MAG: RDD family protein [Actinomycetota bacterium]
MDYEDVVVISTPEGLDLQVVLAGIGSRFLASLIDTAIRGVLIVAMVVAFVGVGAFSSAGGNPSAAGLVAFVVGVFLLSFGYDVLFETLASGQTPGKKRMHLRVIRDGGRPVGFVAAAIRNLLRLVDVLPLSYGVGIVAIVASRRNKRLGDMAAGTLVVVEPHQPKGFVGRQTIPRLDEKARAWDVSAVTADEVATARRFLERRTELDPEARSRLAWELATRLRPKVAGAAGDEHPESFLEQVVAAKMSRR